MRKVSPLGMLAFLNFATAGLGKSIAGDDGKFSISNLAPLLFVAIAGPCFLVEVKSVQKNIVGFFLLSGALGLVAAGWPARRAAKLDLLAAIATD